MAAAVTTALALCALLAGASARSRNGDDHCATAFEGSTHGTPVPLPRVDLPPYQKKWDIQIPSDAACAPGWAVGYQITACDPNGPPPPLVDPLSRREALVTRLTDATSTGSVDVTVYCNYGTFGGGARGDSGEGKVVAVVPYV